MQDLHIVCHREHVEALASGYRQEFQGKDAIAVIGWGHTRKLEQGFVVLEWDGDIDPWFLERLHDDAQVLDFAV